MGTRSLCYNPSSSHDHRIWPRANPLRNSVLQRFCEELTLFFLIFESMNLPWTRSMVHFSPTMNDCDLLQTPAFGSSSHSTLFFLPEYLSSETHGSPPRVLLDPTIQIHFALRDFMKISLGSTKKFWSYFSWTLGSFATCQPGWWTVLASFKTSAIQLSCAL